VYVFEKPVPVERSRALSIKPPEKGRALHEFDCSSVQQTGMMKFDEI